MEELVEHLRQIKGVKSVEKHNGPVFKIKLHGRRVGQTEIYDINGDLRKISQRVRNVFEEGREKRLFSNWEWVVKPEKKYQETSLGKDKLSDRKPKGHKPNYYRVSVEE